MTDAHNDMLVTVPVCSTCYAVLFGDPETDYAAMTPDERAAYDARCAAHDEGVFMIDPGHDHSDPDACSHAGTPCDEDCDCGHTAFSKSPCYRCGSHLYGTRDDALYIYRTDSL